MAKVILDAQEKALLSWLDSMYQYDTTYDFDNGTVHVIDLQEHTEIDLHIANWIYGYYEDYKSKMHYESKDSSVKAIFDDIKALMNSMHMNFADDEEKMADYRILSKEEFLQSYSYLTESEYDLTTEYINKQAI